VAALRGERPEAAGRCPGDGDEALEIPPCRMWQSTEDPALSFEQRVEQLAMCSDCKGKGPLHPDEAPKEAAGDDAEELLLVERLWLEKLAGRPYDADSLPRLTWLLLVEWHSQEDRYRREHEARLKAMMDFLAAQSQRPR
jgi:hypothetical protein